MGTNKQIILGKGSSINNCNIELVGDNNKIIIGDHVWVEQKMIMIKGVSIPNNSIVGIASVVT